MLRRVYLTAAIVVLALFAVGGHNRFEGPTLLVVTSSHGVHAGDLPLVAIAGTALWLLWFGR